MNVETLRGRLGETVEMLELRSVDIYCVQENRFRRRLVRMISGKAAEYVGNEKSLVVGGHTLSKHAKFS